MLTIERLTASHPSLSKVAEWLHQEWGQHRSRSSLGNTLHNLQIRCGDGLPSLYLARDDDEPVGTVSLVAEDLSLRPMLTPWLASLFVDPARRSQGIGSRLVCHVEQIAQEAGVGQLHLFTNGNRVLYERLGWTSLDRLQYRGEAVTVMQRRWTD